MEFTEEQILLRALSRGDEKAFEVLFMRYFPRVKRFISGLLQDDITAEDFAQDILLKLWQKREEMAKIEGNYIQSYSLKPLKGCKFSNQI